MIEYQYQICEGSLTISVSKKKNCSYAAYLLLNNLLLEKQFYQKQAEFQFQLTTEGNYVIQLFEKNADGDVEIQKTEEIIYLGKKCLGFFGEASLKADYGITFQPLFKNCLSEGISDAVIWTQEAILLDLKQEIPELIKIYGTLNVIKEKEELEAELHRKYLEIGKQLNHQYPGDILLLNRLSEINSEHMSEEEYYILEILNDALYQTVYRMYPIPTNYEQEFQEAVLAAVPHISKILFQKEIEFQVILEKEQNHLSAKIIGEFRKTDRFYCYLLKDGKIIETSEWSNQTEFEWTVKESGIYCAQGYVLRNGRKNIRKSATVGYWTEESYKEYQEFMQQEETLDSENEPLPFYEAKEPYCDFAVLTSDVNNIEQQLNLNSFGNRFQMLKHNIDTKQTIVITNGIVHEAGKKKILFSGEGMIETQYVSGMEAAKLLKIPGQAEQFFGAIGTFTMLELEPERIRVSTDYFGFGRLFYLITERNSIISNRYHLLLKLMDQLEIVRELYIEKIKVLLSTVSIQFLQQNMTREMNIRGIKQLLPESCLEREAGETWEEKSSPLRQDMLAVPIFHRCEYKKKLKQAANDILQNLKTILSNPEIENAVVDVTGGLDSRVVYAALTQLPEYREKLRTYTKDTPFCKDLEIALMLNSMYQFPWDALPELWEEQEEKQIRQQFRSIYIGTYYSYRRVRNFRKAKHQIRFTGGGGDFIARPYYSRKYLGTPAARYSNLEQLAEYIASDYSANLLLDGAVFEAFQRLLTQELKETPVNRLTVLERFNYLYLAYRNGFHFHNIMQNETGLPISMPLLSKTLYQLNLQTHNIFQSIRLQLDLIQELNPLLACVKLASEEDERERKAMKQNYGFKTPLFNILELKLQADKTDWEQAGLEKQKNVQKIREKQKDNTTIDEYKLLLVNFQNLMKRFPELADKIGVALYTWIRKRKNDSKAILYMNNKLQSIKDETENR